MITDPTLTRIGEAVQLSHQGERQAARELFDQIWEEIGGEHGDPLHVCTLAHSMGGGRGDASSGRPVPVVAPEPERVLSQAGRSRPVSTFSRRRPR
jgi:hypothetical protein